MYLIESSKEYFKTFSNKDLSGLEKMFAEDVSLRDWEIEVTGIEEVLKANKNIFTSVKSIKVRIIELYEYNNTIIAELLINIDENEIIKVVDVLKYDDNGLIQTIRAYKG